MAHAGWRPKKYEKFLEAMEKVLWENINAIIFTDEELFLNCNDLLTWDDKICYTTFRNYKKEAIKNSDEELLYNQFLSLYKKALSNQKKNLFDSLKSDPQAWQRFAWIIERKFSEWNLRIISENKNVNENYNIQDDEMLKINKALWENTI